MGWRLGGELARLLEHGRRLDAAYARRPALGREREDGARDRARLHVSEQTVKAELSATYARLHARSKVHAYALARDADLL